MCSRAAISFSAEATSSAWARLSSWHGPAMIEIGKALPNLTDPAATIGAADSLAFKESSFSGATMQRDVEGINPNPASRSRISGLRHGRHRAVSQAAQHGAGWQFLLAEAMPRQLQYRPPRSASH